MTDESELNYPQPSRRQVLRTVSSLIALGGSSVVTSTPVAANPGDQLWAFETDRDVSSSPTVVDGTVFVSSDDGNLYAVDAETGQEKWGFKGAYSSPTVVDGTVFVGGRNLYAVDAETGQQQWVFEITGATSPTVVDRTVFVGGRDLHAVDAETSKEQWAFETDDEIRVSPTVVDGTVFVGSRDGNLYAVDTETGQEEWTFGNTTRNLYPPTVADGTVFVSSLDGNLYAVDAETGQKKWRVFVTPFKSSPTVVDGTVFVGSNDNKLYAIDSETGEEEWVFDTDGKVGSSPTVADGTVFVGSYKVSLSNPTMEYGNLYAVDAKTGQEQWAFETDGEVRSSPTVADGTVFFGSDDNSLYAVDAGVSGFSEGSRTKLGTLGHHEGWEHADQSITISDQSITDSRQAEGEQSTGEVDGSEPNLSSGIAPDWSLSSGEMSPLTLAGAIGGTILSPIFGYAAYQLFNSQRDGTDSKKSDTSDTVRSATTADNENHNAPTEDATVDSAQLQERATKLLTQASEAKSNGQYQQAADAYEEALSQFEQAAGGVDNEGETELQAKIIETQVALKAVRAVSEERKPITTTLQAAERSFKEAIARYTAGNQTIAKIRFRQARDAFEEAHQAIGESDMEVLAQPIEVSFEQEATLPSMALEGLAVLGESTVETLAAVDIESITDLESDLENEAITPAVVSDLEESDEIGGEEAALLTLLSWWYEGDNREFTSEKVISRLYEQADYGFNQST